MRADAVRAGLVAQRRQDGEVVYTLEARHLALLGEFDVATITRPENFWVMVQTGDETLDYRQAVARYTGCKQTVEAGGSHTFDGYEQWLPEILGFMEERLPNLI